MPDETLESRVKGLEDDVQRIEKALYGNGQPGLISDFGSLRSSVNLFITEYRTREDVKDNLYSQRRDEDDKREKDKRWKLNTILVFSIGVAGVAATILGVVLSYTHR
jgi:hypothetical protein